MLTHHLKYAHSLLRHIWYVRKMCWHNGLYWQGLVHDLSKWRPDEFIPYAQYFYWTKEQKNDETMLAFQLYAIAEMAPYGHFVDDRFNYAWLYHQKRNPHHWQYWVRMNDDGLVAPMPMPEKYAKEMLCDWWGASMAYGNGGNNRDWYEAHKDNMQLHPTTRAYVERVIQNSASPYRIPS